MEDYTTISPNSHHDVTNKKYGGLPTWVLVVSGLSALLCALLLLFMLRLFVRCMRRWKILKSQRSADSDDNVSSSLTSISHGGSNEMRTYRTCESPVSSGASLQTSSENRQRSQSMQVAKFRTSSPCLSIGKQSGLSQNIIDTTRAYDRRRLSEIIDPEEINSALYAESPLTQEFAEGSKARLLVSIVYAKESESLVIIVHKGANFIPCKNKNVGAFYILLWLSAQETNTQKTATIKSTNPIFEQKFEYVVSEREIDRGCLRFTAFESVGFSRPLVFGAVEFELSRVISDSDGKLRDIWLEFNMETEKAERGTMDISVMFDQNAKGFHISVISCNNLRVSDSDGAVFVKSVVMSKTRELLVKETKPFKGDASDPRFNQMFSIKANAENTDDVYIVFHVLSKSRLRTKSVGKCVVGSSVYAGEGGASQWRRVMEYPGRSIQATHALN